MTTQVFYCHTRYNKPRTGGELAHYNTVNYLISKPDITVKELNNYDLVTLKGVNFRTIFWFLKRFWALTANTIIVEASESYLKLCMANWLLKLRGQRPKILILVHSDPYLGNMNWKGVLVDGLCYKAHVRSADRLIANSLDTCQRLMKLGVKPEKISIITPPAQTLPPPRKFKKQNGIIQIICPANIYAKKGQKTLVEAMHRIDYKRITAVLSGLVKNHRYHQELISMVSQYGLEHRIRFAGYLEGQEMADAYSQSSICVIPSLHEPYGMVVQEAMLHGLVIIASDIGGLTEQINDGVDGLLVPPGDPDALAGAIQRAVNDSDLRVSLLKNVKEKTKTFPTWESVMERTCHVVREMVKEKNSNDELF